MTAALAPLVRQVEARARRDAGFLRVLDDLLEAPSGPAGDIERVAARALNAQRRDVLSTEFTAGALTTEAVREMLGYATPQAVHRLRSRGKLIGAPVGNQTWFPAWQFESGQPRPDLPAILEAIADFTADAVVADRVLRLRRDDLDGASILDALADPTTAEAAWRALRAVGA